MTVTINDTLPENPADSDRHSVVAIAYDGLCTFEFGIAVEVFGLPRPEFSSWYTFEICAIDPPPLRATGGIQIWAENDPSRLDQANTVVLPGWRDPDEKPPGWLLDGLRQLHDRGGRILSICSGVFILAASGLLDGRRATTHWRYADRLRRRYPRIDVDPDVLYIDEGSILTSAGSAAGIDLGLYVIRQDFGTEIANHVARRLVVPPHRDGGQAQFVNTPVPPNDRDGLAPVLAWARRHLNRPLSIDDLAKRAKMSPRTLMRRFQNSVGSSPHRWLIRERLLRAQQLLETTDLEIDRVATEAGFSDAQLLRLHFKRQLGTSPSAYRRTFAATLPPQEAPQA